MYHVSIFFRNPSTPPIDQWFFDNNRPVVVQIGCHDGGWVTHHAMIEPSTNFLVVDSDTKNIFTSLFRASRAFNVNIDEKGISNLKHICVEPSWLYKFIPTPTISSIHIHFPKFKADKLVESTLLDGHPIRRCLVSPRFLQNIHASLKPDGEIHFLTDNLELCLSALQAFHAQGDKYVSLLPAPFFTTNVDPLYCAGLSLELRLGNQQDKEKAPRSVEVKLPANAKGVVDAMTSKGEKMVVQVPPSDFDPETSEDSKGGVGMKRQTTPGVLTSGLHAAESSAYLSTRLRGKETIRGGVARDKDAWLGMDDKLYFPSQGGTRKALETFLQEERTCRELARDGKVEGEVTKVSTLLGSRKSGLENEVKKLLELENKGKHQTAAISVFNLPTSKGDSKTNENSLKKVMNLNDNFSEEGKKQLFYLRFVKTETLGVNWRLSANDLNSRYLAMPPA